MDVNGITSTASTYEALSASKTQTKATTTTTSKDNDGVVYEKSSYSKDNAAIIKQIKADVEKRTSQLRSLVEEMFLKQGQKITSVDDMWKKLASGDFTADAETIANAKAEIADDGYWGVEQTSQRIFDFAVALSGGDSEKMDDMLDAFEKGFGQATKAWGQSLPDISSKTYDAVHEKFEAYKNQTTATE